MELVKWETHSAPGASETDVQDIIDKDIRDEYDLFIGILWKRFGHPTKKFDSGTEQEFNNAYSKYQASPNSVQILFYFKTSTPLSLTDIDPKELEKIWNFKNNLGEKNVLYWEFNKADDLQKFLRIHIPMRLDNLRESITKGKKVIINDGNSISKEVMVEEELGLIDYQEIFEEAFEDSNRAISRITSATEDVGIQVREKTDELESLQSKNQQIGKKAIRVYCRRVAAVMNDFASRIEPEIPIFIDSFTEGINAYSNIVSLFRSDFKDDDAIDFDELSESIRSLMAGIDGGIKGMSSLLNSINRIPRIAKEINKAKNLVSLKLEELINRMEVSHAITNELIKDLNKD